MRKLQDTPRKAKTTKKDPLAEGVIPLNSQKHRDWKSLSDNEIVGYTRKVIDEKGIMSRSALQKEDYGLYVLVSGNSINANRVALKSGGNPGNKMKLNLTYTKL